MHIFSLTGIIIIIANVFLSLLILIKAKIKIHYIWIMFCLNVALWGFGVYRIGLEHDHDMAIIWWKIAYIGVINIPVFYIHFILGFLKIQRRIFLFFLFLITIFFQIINLFTNVFINKVEFLFGQFYYLSDPSIFYTSFVFIFFGTVLYAIVKMVEVIRVSKGYYRTQVKAFLWSSSVGYFGGMFAFFPVYGLKIYPVLNVLVGIFPLLMTYAILKHRMMDIKIVIQKGLVYSFLLSVVTGAYLTILFALDFFFHQIREEMIIGLTGLITTILGIYGAPIIENYFRKKTDKIFFKDKYDYSQSVYQLSKILNKNIKINSLLEKISIKLRDILRTDLSRFILLDENLVFDENGDFRRPLIKIPSYVIRGIEKGRVGVMDKQGISDLLLEAQSREKKETIKILIFSQKMFEKLGAEVFVPIFLEKKLVAMLLLGEKLSGDSYNQDDFSLLKTFSYQAGVAIEKARLFDEVTSYSLELEKKVKNRTSKIRGLQEEQKQMMHEMAHGLQTPLTILKSELTQASEKVSDKKQFKLVERSINRISKMVYDMLRLAKLEDGRDDVVFEKINLSKLLEELIESFEIIVSAQNIKLEYDIAPNVLLRGNANEIEEMITNLVSNSTKYINDVGPKKIFIELKVKNNKINLNISDTGIGMSPDALKHLFKRFYRAKSDSKYFKRGTGLGLVIVKKIVERHKGEIKVQSKLKKGTKFSIIF